jgi:4-amino-4-deoxy-L-arabinose transferase-like glycosyltransferase
MHIRVSSRSAHIVNLAILIFLSGLLFFLGLGSMGLTDRDEGRNAEAGREMLETGNWVSPTFNYEPRFAKPALVYWLMSLSYRWLGIDELSARLPSAAFGLALIVLQYLFVNRFCGAVVGLLSALMLLLNIEMIGLSRMALTDSVLIFFTTLSLYGFWLSFHGRQSERNWRWIFYLAMGIATLAKGPVGFLVPLVTIALYLTATKQWRRFWHEETPFAGLSLFAAVALPWYLIMWSLHGTEYAASAQANTVGRFLSPMEGHGFTILFYVPVLLLGFFPWSGWLPFAWYQAYRSWRTSRGGRGISRDDAKDGASAVAASPLYPTTANLEWFAASWVFGVFVFFTLSSTRLAHYIGPLFPAAALLTAIYWHRSLEDHQTIGRRASIHTMMIMGYLLAVGLASLPSLYPSFAGRLAKEFPLATTMTLGSGPYVASTVLLVGMALVGYFGLSDRRRAGAFWAAGGSLALLALAIIQLVIPGINRYFITPPQILSYAAGLNLTPTDRLIVYGSTRPSTVFYARRKVIFASEGEEATIREALSQPGQTMVVLPETFKSRLPAEAATLIPILKQHGYLLLANRSMVAIPEGTASPPVRTLPGH